MLTTTVMPAVIATALGKPNPSATVADQWRMWIADALMLIQMRVDGITPTPEVDQVKLDYVIREAVVEHVRRPDNATQVTVSVDDGSTSRTYRSGRGRVSILDEWWLLLGLGGQRGRAFEVDTTPDGLGMHLVDYTWVTPTDTVPLP